MGHPIGGLNLILTKGTLTDLLKARQTKKSFRKVSYKLETCRQSNFVRMLNMMSLLLAAIAANLPMMVRDGFPITVELDAKCTLAT